MVGAIDLPALLQRMNDRLEYLLDRDHAIGHAVFMGITSLAELQQVLAQRVIPLLQEYFFEDMERVRLVLTGNGKESVFFKSRSLAVRAVSWCKAGGRDRGAADLLGGRAQHLERSRHHGPVRRGADRCAAARFRRRYPAEGAGTMQNAG